MRALSMVLGVGHLAYVPAFLVAPAIATPGRVSIVAYLNPVWPWVFLVSGLYLVITAATWRGTAWAHAVAGGVFGALAGAGATTIFLNNPPASPALPLACGLLAAVHLTLVSRTPRGRHP